jgi:hypothetical protein
VKTLLGEPMCTLKYNIKMNLKDVRYDDVYLLYMTEIMDHWWALRKSVVTLKGSDFLDWVIFTRTALFFIRIASVSLLIATNDSA